MKTIKQKSREFINISEERTKISIMYTNYMIKMYWSTINTETKAESGFQSTTWLNAEEPSPLGPLNIQIFLILII